MQDWTKILGKQGEDKAAEFLEKKGYRILKRNYRTRMGEIDIIAKKDGVTVFVEVKTRSNDAFGMGFEAVNRRKMNKIIRSAMIYCSYNGGEIPCRFDVISIDRGIINHIENAFTLQG